MSHLNTLCLLIAGAAAWQPAPGAVRLAPAFVAHSRLERTARCPAVKQHGGRSSASAAPEFLPPASRELLPLRGSVKKVRATPEIMPNSHLHALTFFLLLSQFGTYLHTSVLRPILLHPMIFGATLLRHAEMRKSMKKAEFSEGGTRITWIGALVNLFLAFFKLFAGVAGRSAAMVADAGHSFSDLFSDGLTLLALRMSVLPPDVDHPYGHGRFESVASLAIGTLLVGAGASFGAAAMQALRQPAVSPLGVIALWAALASIVSKELLFRATDKVGKRLNSPVLMANAWHHRSDALSSIVAIVGIGGSLLGLKWLDPLAGIAVGSMVLWMGLRILFEALAQLTDTSDYEVVQAVREVAGGVDGIENVDHIRSRSMGGSSFVDLSIQVDPRLSASCAHHLAEEVRYKVINEAEPPISEVLVHVDTLPHDADCPLQTHISHSMRHHAEVEAEVTVALTSLPEVTNVPRVQVVYLQKGLSIEAHVGVLDHLTVAELRDVAERGRAMLMAQSNDIADVTISVDLEASEQGAAVTTKELTSA